MPKTLYLDPMNSSECSCQKLNAVPRVVNSADPDSTVARQEFPESFTNLGVPGDGLLFFYRHSENRLLSCQFCGSFFLYKSTTQDDLITETLENLTPATLAAELDRMESWGRAMALQYPQYFAHKLETLFVDLNALRDSP